MESPQPELHLLLHDNDSSTSSPPSLLPPPSSLLPPSTTSAMVDDDDDALLFRLHSKLKLEIGEIACYISHNHETIATFRYFGMALCAGLRLNVKEVFHVIDSDRYESMTTRLNRTRSVILLLTKRAFRIPHVVAEITKAIELDIPVVPISLERGSFEFTKTLLSSPDFPSKLEKENPGVTKALEIIGIDVKRAQIVLNERLPTFSRKELDVDSDLPTWHAAWDDIFKEIARVIKLESRTGGETRERAMREGPYATYSNSDLRLQLEILKFGMSSLGVRGGGTLDELIRDVYLGKASFERVIATAESVKTDPTKLAICLKLIAPCIVYHYGVSTVRSTSSRALDVIKEALVAFGQEDVEIALAGCEAVTKMIGNNVIAGDSLGMHFGLTEAIVAAMNAFGGKDPEMAKVGCTAVAVFVSITSLTYSTTESRYAEAMKELGAIEAIMLSMRAFACVDAGVAEMGCNAIAMLSRTDINLATTFLRLGAGQVVVAAMKAFSTEYLAVCEGGVKAIMALGDVQRELMELGAGSAVVEALRRAGTRHLSVALVGCEAVAHFFVSSAEISAELMELGAGEAVVAAMRAWGTKDAKVAQFGCKVINGLAFYKNTVGMKKTRAGEVLIAAMRVFGDKNADVAVEGCAAVENAFDTDDDELKVILRRMKIDQVVVAAMAAFCSNDERIAHVGCTAIGRLVSVADDSIRLMKLGAGKLVVAAMRAFGDKEDAVAINGCFAISRLSQVVFNDNDDNDDSHASALMALGAGEAVMKAMKAFGETDSTVAASCCQAIGNLANPWSSSRYSVANRAALMKMGAGEAVVAAVRAFDVAKDESVAVMGFSTISDLCGDCLEDSLTFMRAGAAELLVATMRAIGGTAMQVAENGVYAIYDLISNNDDNAKVFFRLGAAEVVLSAMKAIGEQEKDVAQYGCGVIARLALDDESSKALMGLGAGKVVVSMMQKWGRVSSDVARDACWAISRLAVDETTATELMESGVAEAVVEVMRTFGHRDGDVAACGCLAIARLSRAGRCEKWMSLGVDEVVVRALRCFGERSSEVADRACEAIVGLMTGDARRFWELGAGKSVMEAMRMFGEIDGGVAENGRGVLVRFAAEEEWRSEMKSWEGVEGLLKGIGVV